LLSGAGLFKAVKAFAARKIKVKKPSSERAFLAFAPSPSYYKRDFGEPDQYLGVLTTPFCPGGVGCAPLRHLNGVSDKKVAFALRGVPLRAIPDQ
jgi:hypothetical protein